MDLRNLPEGLEPANRCEARRKIIEEELGADLSMLSVDSNKLGSAEEKNCEQMFGHVPIPVGLAGPLKIHFTSRSGDSKIADASEIYLPLATTEGALVASVNRGCKALTESGGATVSSKYHGMTRSLCFKFQVPSSKFQKELEAKSEQWKEVGEATSDHLKIMSYTIDETTDYLFLTLNCDTDEAMGMNMVTIAAQAVGTWLEEQIEELKFVTVAGNVDSDKKPSQRTHDKGRGYEATAEAILTTDVIKDVLKTTPQDLLRTAHAKLDIGSRIAGAIGSNLQAANIVAALYLATGQDAAHVVEGSLADTHVSKHEKGLKISVRCPAILVGIRGGGTQLPAQSQCLDLLLQPVTKNQKLANLSKCQQLAEIIAAAVLAGEISLLAAQATHTLAKSHGNLAR
ncbi:3-hydroxy-3-methylglutaryl-CoA reductase [Patescibacteria group bacterium]|nr:3-hydroxy-3-methylglutaryl-CoA reductase [Patescibacteria group bacterium]